MSAISWSHQSNPLSGPLCRPGSEELHGEGDFYDTEDFGYESTIVAIHERLSLQDLASLLNVTPNAIWENPNRIRAVVNVPPIGEDGVVSTFHASFTDFLTTSGRAPENIRITLAYAHHDLANECLRIMNTGLRFNNADCKTSYRLNSEQPLAMIPSPLKYASLHWAHHIDAADDARSLDSWASCMSPNQALISLHADYIGGHNTNYHGKPKVDLSIGFPFAKC
jgi:hypothetical protein